MIVLMGFAKLLKSVIVGLLAGCCFVAILAIIYMIATR